MSIKSEILQLIRFHNTSTPRLCRSLVSATFSQLSKNVISYAGAHLDGHQHGGRKPTETSVTEFCCKSVNLSLEELKNIKLILFRIQELFR